MKSLFLVLVFLAWFAAPACADYVAGMAAFERGDYKTALRELKPLAEKGVAKAQCYLAAMYGSGAGVPQDDKESMRWYRLAANQGYDEAQLNLGLLYDTGQRLPQDYVLAHMWYNLAAAQGNENAPASRDALTEKMTPAQIAEAQKLAREWKPKK